VGPIRKEDPHADVGRRSEPPRDLLMERVDDGRFRVAFMRSYQTREVFQDNCSNTTAAAAAAIIMVVYSITTHARPTIIRNSRLERGQ